MPGNVVPDRGVDASKTVGMPLPEVPDTWTTRHYPVLHSVVARFELQGQVTSNEVVDDTGLSEVEVERAARDLDAEGLVDVYFYGGGGWMVLGNVSGEARRLVGAWPSAALLADRLVDAVERGMETAETAQERGRWQKLRDGFASAGRDVIVSAAGSALGGSAGGLL